MSASHPRIWVLLGPRIGDTNQLLGLAEALKLPFETRTLVDNALRRLSPRLLGASRLSLDAQSRRQIAPPWPDLVIGIGRRSVPVARWIRRQSGGRTKIVRIGNPRIRPSLFDLVITTRQYPVPEAENVITLPLAIGRSGGRLKPDANEQDFLSALPRPRLLLALGGRTRLWHMPEGRVVAAAQGLAERARKAGGSLIVASSPRTENRIRDALRTGVPSTSFKLVDDNFPRFRILLEDADEIFITADSVSMISEAIMMGKPVGMIPLDPHPTTGMMIGFPLAVGGRDLRHFWAGLKAEGLVGTVAAPIAHPIEDSAEIAAAAVRRLLG